MIITTVYTMINPADDVDSVRRQRADSRGLLTASASSARLSNPGCGARALCPSSQGVVAVQLMLQVFFSWAALFLIGGIPSSCSHCWATFPAEKTSGAGACDCAAGGRRIA